MSPGKIMCMNDCDAAWLAGLFEGEGTICIQQGRLVRLVIGMCDRDVLERVDRLVPSTNGVKLKKQRNPPPQYKDQYLWNIGKAPEVEACLRLMLPWLGERRRARALEALEVLARHPGGPGWRRRAMTHCGEGHEFSRDNTYIDPKGGRICKICRRKRIRRYRERLKS